MYTIVVPRPDLRTDEVVEALRDGLTIVEGAGRSEVYITPGGLVSDLVLNTLVITRKIHRVPASAPPRRAPSEREAGR